MSEELRKEARASVALDGETQAIDERSDEDVREDYAAIAFALAEPFDTRGDGTVEKRHVDAALAALDRLDRLVARREDTEKLIEAAKYHVWRNMLPFDGGNEAECELVAAVARLVTDEDDPEMLGIAAALAPEERIGGLEDEQQGVGWVNWDKFVAVREERDAAEERIEKLREALEGIANANAGLDRCPAVARAALEEPEGAEK